MTQCECFYCEEARKAERTAVMAHKAELEKARAYKFAGTKPDEERRNARENDTGAAAPCEPAAPQKLIPKLDLGLRGRALGVAEEAFELWKNSRGMDLDRRCRVVRAIWRSLDAAQWLLLAADNVAHDESQYSEGL